MTTSDISFCQQRILAQINRIPPIRFTPPNPYENGRFSKLQLDMRRKVEILKYSANKSSTQTNNMTKKEKFALLVRGGMSRTSAVIQSNIIDCSADQYIPTPTTASDVPGPLMYLYADDSVPLYNYSDYNSRSYPFFDETDQQPWQFVVKSNTLVYDNGTSNIYYLIINNHINQPRYKYTIVTPIGIAVAGSIPNQYSLPLGFSGNIQINLVSATLLVYYGDGLAKSIDTTTVLTNFIMDVGVQTANAGTFSATSFLGNLIFPNIELYTAPTYVYNIILSVNLTTTPSNTGLIKYTALVANITNPNNVATNNIVINNASSAIYISPSITGV
jgi:hypothetical protein